MGNHYFGDGAKDKKSSELVEKALDEALEGAGQTLKFSIMNAVVFTVTEYLLVKVVAGSASIFTYIKTARVINTVKRKVVNSFGSIPFVGRFAGEALTATTALAIGNQNERLAMAKMANSNMNSLTTAIGQERQTKTLQVSSQRNQVMQTLGLNTNSKGLKDTKKLEAYYHKMKTGTWTKSTIDKNLFLNVVPREYIGITFSWNSNFVTKLNSFTEYAKSTEGKLTNIAQTNLDLMTAHYLSKVQ